jgi:GntR family transcriptional regulator, transcriptional repressor for pyruvate dehydrogenase complex
MARFQPDTSMKTAPIMTPLVVPKASDVLAARLRDLILNGALAPGVSLPPERDLVIESGLSRAPVREALRVLESEGLIATRPGRTGGSIVTLPGRASVARSVEQFVRTHGVGLEALLDCRLAVEPMLAKLAAANRTAAELQELERIHAAFVTSTKNVATYKRVNLEWHLAVARASRNEPLTAVMEAISQPIMDAARDRHVTTPEIRRAAVKAHTAIMRAIRAQDTKAAFAGMERHLSAYGEVARSKRDGEPAR